MRSKFEKFFNNKRNMWLCVLVCVAGIFLIQNAMRNFNQDMPEFMSYPNFEKALAAGEVDTVYYNKANEYMTVTFFNDETKDMTEEERQQYQYSIEDQKLVKYPAYEEFRKDVLESGATITQVDNENIVDLVMNLLSIFFTVFMLIMLMAMLRSGPLGMLSDKNKKALLKTSDVKFSDVIGQDEVIEDLRFIVDLMKHPGKGEAIGAKVPKGLLLQGPPGTGKTLLAKAIAGEAGVPFIEQSGSAFIEMYVGMGARRVRDLFELARKNAPCVIFIDEIDAVGIARDSAKSSSEHEQTINALLEQMDGFESRSGIFVIAATNRADKLDEALVRPGRFDRQVTVNPPRDWKVRVDLFKHYLAPLKVDPELDIKNLALQTPGFTGADIAAICNEAGIIAMMNDAEFVDAKALEEAIDKKIFKGNRSKREQFEKDRHVIAYHEAGHAVMTWLMGEPISRASIQSTVSGVGGAVFGADKESVFMTQKDFQKQVTIAYAGRASEEIKFGTPTTGASNDITQATNMLLQYVERYGFDSEFGLLDYQVLAKDHIVPSNESVKTVRKLSKEIYTKTKSLLEQNYPLVELLAERLLNEESLTGDQITRALKAKSESMKANALPAE